MRKSKRYIGSTLRLCCATHPSRRGDGNKVMVCVQGKLCRAVGGERAQAPPTSTACALRVFFFPFFFGTALSFTNQGRPPKGAGEGERKKKEATPLPACGYVGPSNRCVPRCFAGGGGKGGRRKAQRPSSVARQRDDDEGRVTDAFACPQPVEEPRPAAKSALPRERPQSAPIPLTIVSDRAQRHSPLRSAPMRPFSARARVRTSSRGLA
jgi:hypothetical protein